MTAKGLQPAHGRWIRAAGALLVTAALAACSGGGGGSSSLSTQAKRAKINIKIAGGGTQSKLHRLQGLRRPKYVSQATNGLAIFAYPYGQNPGGNPTAVADVSATSPYCTVAQDGSGDRVCGIPITVNAGPTDFLVNGYDQVPKNGVVQGNLLEQGTAIDVNIVPSGANQVNLTFDGEIASIAIVPVWQTSQNDGLTHAYSFAVNAYDADNYAIIDVTPFANALSVAIANDPNATLSVTPPASGTDPRFYTLNYNGGLVTDAQITASAVGVSQTTTMDFTPMITSPQNVTVQVNGTANVTAQMALPANETAQSFQFWTSSISGQSNCGVSPDGYDQYPYVNGNPVTFTVNGVFAGPCTFNLIGPEVNSGFSDQTITVTVQASSPIHNQSRSQSFKAPH